MSSQTFSLRQNFNGAHEDNTPLCPPEDYARWGYSVVCNIKNPQQDITAVRLIEGDFAR